MKHLATQRFWGCYRVLPEEVRRGADSAYALLKQDSRHPSLHLKKIGRFWSVRIGLHHRALAVEHDPDLCGSGSERTRNTTALSREAIENMKPW